MFPTAKTYHTEERKHKLVLHLDEVYSVYKDLHEAIAQMDGKIGDVVRKHQASFLTAYKNHLYGVKRELQILKTQSDADHDPKNIAYKVNLLERQIFSFREQSSQLYQKLEVKNEEMVSLKRQISDKNREIDYLTECNKQLLKTIKYLQVTPPVPPASDLSTPTRKISLPSSVNRPVHRQLPIETLMNAKMAKVHVSTPVRQVRDNRRVTRALSTSFKAAATVSSVPVLDNELKDWFVSCIRSIKKQIAQRRQTAPSFHQLMTIESLDDFLTTDKLRLLELFLQNEKSLVWIYEKLFPSRLNEIQAYFKGSQVNQINHVEQGGTSSKMTHDLFPQPAKASHRPIRPVVRSGQLSLFSD